MTASPSSGPYVSGSITSADRLAILSARSLLLKAGYAPLAIHSIWSTARTAHGTLVEAGKQPLVGWRDPDHPSRSIARLLDIKSISANTGIITGAVRAVDIDIADTELCWKYLSKALTSAGLIDLFNSGRIPLRHRSNSSKCLLVLRSDDPSRRKVTVAGAEGHKVEFLGDGQQFVCDGWHPSDPTGGVKLQWHPNPLWNYPVADLVVLTPEIELAFIDAALEILPEAKMGAGGKRGASSGVKKAACGNWGDLKDAPATDRELAEIADKLPNDSVNWDTWNTTLMRFFAASHGSAGGLAAAQKWSDKILLTNPGITLKYSVASRWETWRRSPTSAPSRTGTGALVNAVREALGKPDWYFTPVTQQEQQGASQQTTGEGMLRQVVGLAGGDENPSAEGHDDGVAAEELLHQVKETFDRAARIRGARRALGDVGRLLERHSGSAAQVLHKVVYFALGKGCGEGMRLQALEELVARFAPAEGEAGLIITMALGKLGRKDPDIARRGRRSPAHRKVSRRHAI